MTLSPGTRLGPYEVSAQIGMGGMGEVYRATDTNLGRQVAIKVLPNAFAQDADRLARFEREAKTLAALNHPRIAQIYGLEKSGGRSALVLEFVAGPTLADRIARGPLPPREALLIANQIAEALEAAHEHGIIHRDLKPANVKASDAGMVKVLDFGLAKVQPPPGSVADTSVSPTITSPAMTQAGVILGTAAYMSPEQARGLAVDGRTDVWAFGCVLFEMLTGRRAFAGDTVSDTIARILEREPEWSALPGATPPAIRRLLMRCLQKDLGRRLHHIGDARLEIEDALDGTVLTGEPRVVPDSRLVRWSMPTAVIASIVALVAVGTLAWSARTSRLGPSAPPRISRLTMASTGNDAVAINDRGVAITPDGTRIVYLGNNRTQLFVRSLDRLEPTAILTAPTPLNYVFLSPDSQWIGFVEGSVLKKISMTGGPVVTIAEGIVSATWAQDDVIIVATTNPATGLGRVSAAGGEATVLTRPLPERNERDHLWPEILPGGRAVLFTMTAVSGGLDAAQVAVLDLGSGTSTVLVRGGSHAHYVPTGHLIYAAGGGLRAVPFDLDRLETRGPPVAVLPRLATTPQGAANFDVASDGTLAYVDTPDPTTAGTLVWVDRQGREEPLGAPARPFSQPRVSPDGTRIAVAMRDEENDIWMWDLARRTLNRRTFDPGVDFFPVWTPDGNQLIFAGYRDGRAVLVSQRADGTGPADVLSGPLSGTLPTAVTPDGTAVIFSIGARDLMLLRLDATRAVRPLIQTPANERNGIVSPDGRWLAYESDTSGRFEVYVRPFPDTSAGQWLISAGGTRPVWATKSPELFYEAPGGAIMAVRVDARGATWNAGSPAKVVEGRYATQGGSIRNYDVSADGRRLLMIKQVAGQGAAPQIVVVQNWFEELKRLVPTP